MATRHWHYYTHKKSVSNDIYGDAFCLGRSQNMFIMNKIQLVSRWSKDYKRIRFGTVNNNKYSCVMNIASVQIRLYII